MCTRIAAICLIVATGSCLEAIAGGDAGTVDVKAGEIVLKIPSTWEKQQPKSRLRLLQFRVPALNGDTEDTELAVFQFGGGGTIDQNVRRWINQFVEKDRMVRLFSGTATAGKYVLADLSGTYKKPIGPPIAGKTQEVPGTRVIAVMLVVPQKGVIYLKMAGPDGTVAAQASAIRAAIGASADQEKEYSLRS